MTEMDDQFGLRIGDVTPMTSCTVVYGYPRKPNHLKLTFKAKTGRRLVFMFLGDETNNDSQPLDPVKRLYELGWSHPELKPEN